MTAFVGLTTPGARPAVGVAVGGGGSTVRFEIEGARTLGGGTPAHPSGGSLSANILVQSTPSIHGVQVYGTGGFGFYGETGSGEVGAKNLGGGVKIALGGPLRLRLDYRVYMLGNAPDAASGFVVQKHPQRLSVGLNFAF